ncbi:MULTISPECIES: DUF4870 domain-containing protein [unclassified Chryseobacterium]|uniref:DUF4870 domain-containing protein n=1 Tax=unclassified Chryseobacterium TaxID=2593645 RepID=UPI001157F58D|nr:DUF4870 domain-containing protein [Chryseobacterium sp. ON_d1]GEJ45959.1 membrane protein [Chryseobacterium sp. ON_d1]
MKSKTAAILSYITIIGWLVAYIKRHDITPKSDLVTYHLKQGLGLFIISVLFNLGLWIILFLAPMLYFINYIGIVLFILFVIGVINAASEAKKPLPLIGKFFENQFKFIDE